MQPLSEYESDKHDLVHALHVIREKADYYCLAEDYYRGEVGEVFTSPAVQRALKGNILGFNVNLACRPVDAVLDRVEIASISAGEDDALSQQLRDLVWNANKMGRYSKIVHRGSLVFGDSYLIVWPTPGEEDEAQGVQINYNSPKTTRVFYDPEDPKKKSYAAKTWVIDPHSDKRRTRLNLYYEDRVERYISKPGSKGEVAEEFDEYTEDGEQWPIPNPFGEIPVFHFRTDEPYGRPEHRNAWGPQNAITKIGATQMANIDFSAFPQRWMITEGIGQIGGAQAGIEWDDEQSPLDRHSGLESGPGKVWNLPDTIKEVGQFEPADPKNFLDPMAQYVRLMASSTGTPLRHFDPQGEIPSGEALRADEAPLAARIKDREEWWEETWNEALVFAAKVVGLPVEQVDIQWAPVQVVDDKEGWETVLLKIEAGVPAEKALVEAGYLSSLVAQWEEDGLLDQPDQNTNTVQNN